MNKETAEEISKILASTKYRFPIKTERRDGKEVVTEAVYMVDIPAVVKHLEEQYTITKKV